MGSLEKFQVGAVMDARKERSVLLPGSADLGTGLPRSFRLEALLSRTEGIIPAIESAHAVAGAHRLARSLGPDATILINLSGRGDKDVATAAAYFVAHYLPVYAWEKQRLLEATSTDLRLHEELRLLRRERGMIREFGALPPIYQIDDSDSPRRVLN